MNTLNNKVPSRCGNCHHFVVVMGASDILRYPQLLCYDMKMSVICLVTSHRSVYYYCLTYIV